MADTHVSPASKLRADFVHLSPAPDPGPAPVPAPVPLLSNGVGEEEEEEHGMDALEKQVSEIGDRLQHFRSTLPGLFHGALESFLASKRPTIPQVGSKEGGPQIGDGTDFGKDNIQQNKKLQMGVEDRKIVEKIELLKARVARNVESIPIVLKRVNECLMAVDELERYELNVHPCFRRRRL